MKIEQNTKSNWKTFFRTHPIFDNLTLSSLEKLFYLVELKVYSRNQVIFKQGDEVNGFYLIYEGEVLKTKKVESNFNEKIDIGKFIQKKSELQEGKILDNFHQFFPWILDKNYF